MVGWEFGPGVVLYGGTSVFALRASPRQDVAAKDAEVGKTEGGKMGRRKNRR